MGMEREKKRFAESWRKRGIWRSLRACARALAWLGIAASAVLAVAVVVSWFAIDWDAEGADEYPGGTVLRDSAGNVMRVSLGPDDVDCRPWYEADENDWIVKALVASEDGSFWTHCGVRPLSVARAFVQNVFYRRRISGASTITMQAVRLIRPHRKSYAAKWVEAFRALKMERRRSKKWIISQYLNRAPFGANFIGIEAAAQGWFGKGAKDLGIGEAAMLAGMVQAPSRFRPDRGYERAMKRRDYVLSRMIECGLATAEQVEGAKGVRPEVTRAKRPFEHPFYCDWYLNEVLGRDRNAQRRSGDFTTPLDADIQCVCERAVGEAASAGGYEASAVVMKVATGEVVAMAASGDYFNGDGGQVNTALAPRPAGSTLKPFLVAKALEAGIVGSESEVLDAPMAVKGYRPVNFDGKFRGRLPLRDALILSLNLPFVRLCRDVGVERFGAYLRDLGFAHMRLADDDYGLGMAIGNVETTLLELVRAYRALAASGTPEAYIVSDMLSGKERSAAALGHVADVQVARFAWKTGTSSAYRDAWTVAWNPEYVVGVWCGHIATFGDESVVGAKAAAPLAWRIARSLYPRAEGPWFRKPDGVDAMRTRRLPGAGAEKVPLAIAKPERDAVFRLVPGGPRQRLVATVVGNPDGRRLWWFIDGAPVGETVGTQPFVSDMTPGRHVIVCAAADGESAETSVLVESP